MWDFLPMERDEYVTAEDDAVQAEHARIRKRDGIVVETEEREDGRFSDERIPDDDSDVPDSDEGIVNDGPEFAQEYESPEDVYAEQEAGEDW